MEKYISYRKATSFLNKISEGRYFDIIKKIRKEIDIETISKEEDYKVHIFDTELHLDRHNKKIPITKFAAFVSAYVWQITLDVDKHALSKGVPHEILPSYYVFNKMPNPEGFYTAAQLGTELILNFSSFEESVNNFQMNNDKNIKKEPPSYYI